MPTPVLPLKDCSHPHSVTEHCFHIKQPSAAPLSRIPTANLVRTTHDVPAAGTAQGHISQCGIAEAAVCGDVGFGGVAPTDEGF